MQTQGDISGEGIIRDHVTTRKACIHRATVAVCDKSMHSQRMTGIWVCREYLAGHVCTHLGQARHQAEVHTGIHPGVPLPDVWARQVMYIDVQVNNLGLLIPLSSLGCAYPCPNQQWWPLVYKLPRDVSLSFETALSVNLSLCLRCSCWMLCQE